MRGSVRAIQRLRLPGGLIALVALVEASLARHALDQTRFPILDWKVGGRSARGAAAASSEVLCCGHSLVQFGLVPRVLKQRLGVHASNLAVCDGQAPSSYRLM